jgi:hypothetical protein
MRERQLDLQTLRRSAAEWRRRGLTPPEAIEAMVTARINEGPFPHAGGGQDPAYADFFSEIGLPEAAVKRPAAVEDTGSIADEARTA